MSPPAGSAGVSAQQCPSRPLSKGGVHKLMAPQDGWLCLPALDASSWGCRQRGSVLDPGQDAVERTICLLWIGSPSSGIRGTDVLARGWGHEAPPILHMQLCGRWGDLAGRGQGLQECWGDAPDQGGHLRAPETP